MARFINSTNLFGAGYVDGTTAELVCDMCRAVHNKGIGLDNDNDDDWDDGESILYTQFAELQVCECCFEKIENEVLHRMQDILKWYKKIIAVKKEQLDEAETLLNGVTE